MCSNVSFLNILAQKEHRIFLRNVKFEARFVLQLYRINRRLLRELAFLESEPTLRRMLVENRAALPTKNTACGMENVLIFQEMLDFSTPVLNWWN